MSIGGAILLAGLVRPLLLALSRNVLVTLGFLWGLGRFGHTRLPAVFSALILLAF